MAEHDHAYRLLFAHARMVRDLLEGFLGGAWQAELDLSSLDRVNSHYVSEDLRVRQGDMVWRVRWRGRWLYVLLEFQSSVDAHMVILARLCAQQRPAPRDDLQETRAMLEERVAEWAEEIRQRSIREGLQQGRQQGESLLLSKLLRRRFGELPAWVTPRLQQASPEQLERWAERLLEADDLETLFDDGDLSRT